MSSYYYEEVVRLKLSQNELKRNGIDSKWNLEDMFPNEFNKCEGGKFEVAPTEGDFLDLLIVEHIGDGGEYGNSRYLTDEEVNKYLPMFKKILPFARAEDMRYVTFSWYNCSEAPDYFDVPKEVKPCNSVEKLLIEFYNNMLEDSINLEEFKHGILKDKSRHDEKMYTDGRLDENLERRVQIKEIMNKLGIKLEE